MLIIAGDVSELGETIMQPIRQEFDILRISSECIKLTTEEHGR
jgi:hypothetical protein